MAREVYRVEIPIEAIDNYSAPLKQAERHTTQFEKKIDKHVTRINKRLNDITNGRWSVTINAVDRASRVASRVSSYIHRVANRGYRFTLRAYDMATRTIGGIRRAITGIPALITIGLSVVGAGKLKDATVGAAMSFEQYEVSMEHWLGGNTKQAKELVKWMGSFADTTPFSSVDLFPALTRGIGVTGGDVKQAQDLLKLSADMAALTPGSSVSDAMEALADSQMGEMERLKAFNVKISKKEMDKIGFGGVVEQLTSKFDGGARKLSQTSEGIISTLKGYRSSLFRSMGEGFLDPMKPRLDAINNWLADNQDTWGRWKDTVKGHGKQASEFVFSNLEKGFNHVQSRYLNNKDFMDLSFKGKFDFVMSDVNQWWSSKGKPAVSSWWESSGKPWAAETGLSVGKAIFDGIVLGIKQGMSTIGDLWKNAFKEPSFKSVGGAATATVLAGAAGSMLLSPFLKAGGGVIRGGKRVAGQVNKFGSNRVKRQAAKAAGMPKGAYQDSQGRWHHPDGKFMSGVDVEKYADKKNAQQTTRTARRTAERTSKLPSWLGGGKGTGTGSKILKRIPILGALLGTLAVGSATKEERPGVVGSVAGGLAGAKGGAMAGAAIGSAVPVIGTAAGGIIGGLVGGVAGAMGGEWLGGHWDTIKEKASDAAAWVGSKFSSAKDTVSSTLFSSSWWSGKWSDVKSWGASALSDTAEWWEGVQQTASETFFSAGWWAQQVGFVYGYLESTLFSGEWWGGHWDSVMSWTSERWESASAIWNSVTAAIGSTIFSGEWWGSQWDTVVAWSAERWESAQVIWDSITEAIGSTVFSGEWWGSQWESVKAWTSASWESFSSVWESAKETISSTLFSQEWWSGKWGAVKGWAQSAWNEIKSGFVIGQEEGNKAAGNTLTPRKYARGGYISSPHLGLVGEAGPEMIIPLSSGRRNRAMDLFQRTGEMLGVRPYAEGGMAGTEPIVPGYGDKSPTLSLAGTMGGAITSGNPSPVHVSAPLRLEINGGGMGDETQIKAIVTRSLREFVDNLKEALNNRA